ncbi:MAG: sugar phosphate isomerase/epimerase family protein [Bryobacteraceae bacterium]|jgi:sugar phosphate isomerase/epimerase
MISRREWLVGSAALLAAGRMEAFKSHLAKASISAITDAIGTTQADAIAFAQQYGLQWVELRNVPETKKEFAFLTEPELKRWATELAANKLKVSFLDTSLLKFTWPGTAPVTSPEDQKRWDRRKEDLASALMAANIFGVDKVRIFTGTRATHPETTYPMIVKTMEELIPMAENAKVRLLIQNGSSQNIGTSAEAKAILELLPSKTIGLNWDPQDALPLHEVPWPDGYRQIPKGRLLNTQFKFQSLLGDGPERIDWKAILEALQKDNYRGQIGLETHVFDGTLIEKAHECMKEMLHMVGELS